MTSATLLPVNSRSRQFLCDSLPADSGWLCEVVRKIQSSLRQASQPFFSVVCGKLICLLLSSPLSPRSSVLEALINFKPCKAQTCSKPPLPLPHEEFSGHLVGRRPGRNQTLSWWMACSAGLSCPLPFLQLVLMAPTESLSSVPGGRAGLSQRTRYPFLSTVSLRL